MKAAILSFTLRGKELNLKLQDILRNEDMLIENFTISKFAEGLKELKPSLKEWMKDNFNNYDAFIFIGAAGIAVRSIAPFIKSKDIDPAVIVMDEGGNFVIPILSGHIGGANNLALKISKAINSQAVLTTATDINEKFAVDNFAVKNNLYIDDITKIKEISSRVLENKKIGLLSDVRIEGNIPEVIDFKEKEAGICISYKALNPFHFTMNLYPKNLALGIGCRKNKPMEDIESLVFSVLEENNISLKSIKGVYSIDLKKNEEGLLDFCEKYKLSFKVFTSDELKEAPGEYTKSAFVSKVTGVDNVCERAAVLGSNKGKLIIKKTSANGVTVSIAKEEWSVLFE